MIDNLIIQEPEIKFCDMYHVLKKNLLPEGFLLKNQHFYCQSSMDFNNISRASCEMLNNWRQNNIMEERQAFRGVKMQIDPDTAKNIVSTLKSGVIPGTGSEFICTGRGKALKEFEGCLGSIEKGGGIVKFITGEYGSGKSFLLNNVRQLALNRDFAVCSLQIGNGLNLSSFDALYYSIMHNITIKDSTNGSDFETIFGSWIGRLKLTCDKNRVYEEINEVIASLDNFNSSFSRAFLTYIKARISHDSQLSSAAASWIKGEKNIPAQLKAKFNVKGDIDKLTAIDSFKAFLHLLKLLGYKGLVLLVDELELLMSQRADVRKICYENLRYIVDSTCGGDFKNCLFVFAATDEFFEDRERGVKTYHALYQRLGDAPLSDNPVVMDMRLPIMRMTKLSHDDLLMLAEKIILLHKTAYNWTPYITAESARNWVLLTLNKGKSGSQLVNTREFNKKLIEFLDILEQNPGYNMLNSGTNPVNRINPEVFINI